MITASSQDRLIATRVEHPWQEACVESPYPWLATEGLKEEWIRLIQHGATLEERIAGVTGLGRCAGLTPIEQSIVENFLLNEELETQWEQMARRLVQGAYCPGAFWTCYFLPNLGSDDSPLFHHLMGSWLRNPARAEIAQTMLGDCNELSSWLRFCCFINPKVSLASITPKNEWEEAYLAALEQKNSSPLLTWFFRASADFYPSEWERLLPGDLYEIGAAFVDGDLNQYDPANPSKDAITRACKDGIGNALRRYRNPLLCPPWLRELPDDRVSDAIFVCYTAAGFFPGDCVQYEAFNGKLGFFLRIHPAFC